jgi:hypothetical protein
LGLYTAIYSEAGANIEYAVLELLDLAAARAASPPVYDDVLGSLFLPDTDGDGIGDRNRPTTQVTIRAKVSTWPKQDMQAMDQTGNDPDSRLFLTLYEDDLAEAGLLANGVLSLKPDDRLLKLLNSDGIQATDGTVRFDFTRGGTRKGLRCLEVRPGLTGERTVRMVFESQRESASGLAG